MFEDAVNAIRDMEPMTPIVICNVPIVLLYSDDESHLAYKKIKMLIRRVTRSVPIPVHPLHPLHPMHFFSLITPLDQCEQIKMAVGTTQVVLKSKDLNVLCSEATYGSRE